MTDIWIIAEWEKSQRTLVNVIKNLTQMIHTDKFQHCTPKQNISSQKSKLILKKKQKKKETIIEFKEELCNQRRIF